MRVVLDTNSLIVCIGRESRYRPIFDAILAGKIRLLISNDILHEYVEILGSRTSPLVADSIASFLTKSPDVEKIQIYFKWGIITQDADDNKFVDCALNGRADFLVTDDKHFNLLHQIGFPPPNVIRTAKFLTELEQRFPAI